MTRRLKSLHQLVMGRRSVLNLGDLVGQRLQANQARHALLHLHQRTNRIDWLAL